MQNYAKAEIRYVKAGNPTPVPPYTSWATAADSIGRALDLAVDDDTVIVGTGYYSAPYTGDYTAGYTIPYGVSLIGVDADSCIVFAPVNSYAFYVSENTSIQSLTITGENGIARNTGYTVIKNNLFKNIKNGVRILNGLIENNCFINNTEEAVGLSLFFGPAYTLEVRNNRFHNCYQALNITAVNDSQYVYFTNNIITYSLSYPQEWISRTIRNFQNANYNIIKNNIIYVAEGKGIFDAILMNTYRDTVINNVVSSRCYSFIPFLIDVYHPYVIKNNHFERIYPATVYSFGQYAINNGVSFSYNSYYDIGQKYYSDGIPYTNPYEAAELNADPMFVESGMDFHLQKFSPLIDRGDPVIKDKDGTRSDIGAYG